MLIVERIFDLLELQRKTQVELANHLGINRANVTRWKERKSNIPAQYIAPMSEFFNVSAMFLLTGEKVTANGSEDERLLELFHALSDEGKEKALEQLEFFATRYSKKSHKDKMVG